MAPPASPFFLAAPLRVLATCVLLLAPPLVQANDLVWLDRADGGALRARAGSLERPAAALPALSGVRATDAAGKELAVRTQAGQIDVAAAPQGDGDVRLVAQQVTDQGALVIYQARLGRQDTQARNDLELVPTSPDGNTFRLVWKGQPVAASQVHVQTSAGWGRVLVPGKDGTVQMDTPFAGLYVMEVSARVNGSATVDGKKYDEVRHTATLSFEVAR